MDNRQGKFSSSHLASAADTSAADTSAADTSAADTSAVSAWGAWQQKLVFVLLFNLLLLLVLLFPVLPHRERVITDNIAQALGPFLMFFWSRQFKQAKGAVQNQGTALRHHCGRLPHLFLGLGTLGYAVGQTIWTYYELVLHQATPFPSWADAGYLSAYPCLLAGVLTLPIRPILSASRFRVLVDSMMVMVALVTFNWYFVLGPTLMQEGETLPAKVLGTAYPLSDLVLLCCVIFLFLRSGGTALRPAVTLVCCGLCAIITADTVFDYQTLHGSYVTGHPIDLCWPLGYMLVGVASYAVRVLPAEDGAAQKTPREPTAISAPPTSPAAHLVQWLTLRRHLVSRRIPIFSSLLPYVLVPAVGGLVWHTAHATGDEKREAGVYLGAALLISLLLFRQFLTLLENQRLALELRAFNENLEQLVAQRTELLSLRTEELGIRTETLTSLQHLTVAVNETLSVDKVLSAGLKHTQAALRSEGAALWVLQEKVQSSFSRHFDLGDRADLLPFLDALPAGESTVSCLLPLDAGHWLQTPFCWQGKVLGRIGVARWDRGFDHAEADLLESIGLQIATALENAHQFHAAREAANRDSVTGLLNHRAIHQHLDTVLEAARETQSSLAVLMTDMDNFKLFNDTYGHPAGDKILQRVARVLNEECGPDNHVARYGGDEFLIVLPLGAGGEQAISLAVRLRNCLARETFQHSEDERSVPLGLSFGMAAFPQDSENRHDLINTADANLYAAKNSDERIVGLSDMQRGNRALRTLGSFRTLDSMVTAVDNKDRYTRRHSEDVAAYSLWIAEELGLDEDMQRLLRMGGLLHDVGKIGVPDEILRKPGRLTEEEYEALKQHALLGACIVGGVPGMEEILSCVRHHHERWDGTGYPDRLPEDSTPLMARILAVADAVSAMTTDRPYRKGMGWETALSEVSAGRGTQFDPSLADAFLCAAGKHQLLPQPAGAFPSGENTLSLAA